MRQLVFSTMVSLDGYVNDSNGELGWIIIDEELHRYVNAQCSEMGAFLHGRRTYESMVAYWPTADADPSNPDYVVEFARIWQVMPKVVFSKTLDKVAPTHRLVTSDAAEEIARLKAEPGKDLMLSGADFAATSMRLGLIDEYQIYVHPVVLGGGTPLFKEIDERIKLRLVGTRAFDSGVVLLHYRCGGVGE